MKKDTKADLKKSNIFDEAKREKQAAIKALRTAKEIEQIKIKEGWVYVTSDDGKTSKLQKLK